VVSIQPYITFIVYSAIYYAFLFCTDTLDECFITLVCPSPVCNDRDLRYGAITQSWILTRCTWLSYALF